MRQKGRISGTEIMAYIIVVALLILVSTLGKPSKKEKGPKDNNIAVGSAAKNSPNDRKDDMLSNLMDASMVVHKPGKNGGTFTLVFEGGKEKVYPMPPNLISAGLFEVNGFTSEGENEKGWTVWKNSRAVPADANAPPASKK